MLPADRQPRFARTAAVAMGLVTFALRLLSLRNLPNDHYMHLVWANELLAGQVPGRDFIDPGMPLMYTASAAVQWFSPNPFGDAMLWLTLLAIAGTALCLVTARITSSTAAGVAAGLLALALEPRLYSVPKVLVPAVGLLLLLHYASRPATRGLVGLAAWTAVAGLLRHDLGAFNAVGVVTGLLVLHTGDRRARLRALGIYAGALGVFVLPYALFVQIEEGLVEHLRVGLETSAIEAHRVIRGLPEFPYLLGGTAWSRVDSAAALFTAARLVPVAALGLLVWLRRQLPRPALATAAAACATLACYAAFILRHPVEARVQDVAAVFPIVLVWSAAQGARLRPRPLTTAAAALAVGLALVGAGHLSQSLERLDDAQVWKGTEKMRLRAAAVREEGSVWPWDRFWSQGDFPPVIEYLHACTQPADRVFITWFAPDYYYFSRRLMAGGIVAFFPGRAFSSDDDQRRLIDRLERTRPPIVLTNNGRDPIENVHLVEAYLRDHYTPAGTFEMYDGSIVTLSTRRGLAPLGTYGPDRWPCRFVEIPQT